MNLALLNVEVARKGEARSLHRNVKKGVKNNIAPSTKIITLKIEAVRFSEMFERIII
jgi:hypothetical protein